MTRQPLVTRYVILKGKLQKEIANLEWLKPTNTVLLDAMWNEKTRLDTLINKQIRLHRESLRLLEDTYNGEDIDIT